MCGKSMSSKGGEPAVRYLLVLLMADQLHPCSTFIDPETLPEVICECGVRSKHSSYISTSSFVFSGEDINTKEVKSLFDNLHQNSVCDSNTSCPNTLMNKK